MTKIEFLNRLEPDKANFLKLTDYIAEKSLKNTIASRNGAWNCQMPFLSRTGNKEISSVDTGSSILQESENITIYGGQLDNLFGDRDITLIKINYYTGVKEALEECEGIIRKNRPKLAISVGFDIYNILELSEWIDLLNIGYKFFLRCNRAMSSAFALYAIAEKEICYAKK